MKKYGFIIPLMLLIFSGCRGWDQQVTPSEFTKDKAITRAQKELKKYAADYNIPISEFKGPYLEEGKGLDFPTYIVCYKNKTHYFCFDDWTRDRDANRIQNIKIEAGDRFDWLRQQK